MLYEAIEASFRPAGSTGTFAAGSKPPSSARSLATWMPYLANDRYTPPVLASVMTS
jgi:hypothetical protein